MLRAKNFLRPVWVLAAGALLGAALAGAVPPGTDDEIRARLEPFGSVSRVGEAGAPAAAMATGPLTGDQVYDRFCFACHAAGVGGAPTFADATAWAPRIDKGMDALVASTVSGLGLMPPMGTCITCSEDDIRAAVDYMVDAAR